MYGILELHEDERRTLFRNTAQKMGVREAIVEKDYWVCLVLDYLFHRSIYAEHLTFKGGTSLSKCFGIIKRFSEDIDLILDWRLLGYDKNEPWLERSKTKQDSFNKDANLKAESFLNNEFLPQITIDLSEILGETARVEIEKNAQQTIGFQYPQIFNTSSILQSIRLEIGALAAWTPAVNKSITPYIFEHYPKIARQTETVVLTSSAERTFWEKVTILHHEANRPQYLEMPKRYSRHYYDLFCIAKTEYKTGALNRIDLLNKVAAFKIKFYPRAWAKYEDAHPGSIQLVPPDYRLETLRKDYESMAEMLFDISPSFDELISSISDLEMEINDITV